MTWEITLRGRRRSETWLWRGEAADRAAAIAQARTAFYEEHHDWGSLASVKECEPA